MTYKVNSVHGVIRLVPSFSGLHRYGPESKLPEIMMGAKETKPRSQPNKIDLYGLWVGNINSRHKGRKAYKTKVLYHI